MSSAACPYCRAAIEPGEADTLLCPGCGTPHHADCFEENGGCTVFGCSAAPAAEPKLSIGAHDLESAAGSVAPPGGGAAPPPPPPPLGGSTPPPASSYPPSAPMFSSLGYSAPRYVPPVFQPRPPEPWLADPSMMTKNRTTFLLLGVFLGAFGAHSFYAGSIKKGFIQLGISLITCGFGGLMVWIWAVIDICTINTDHDGIPFRN